MSEFELGFFLIGGLLMLALFIWSMRIQDLERQGNRKAAILFGLVFGLLFVTFGLRIALHIVEMSDAKRIVAGLTAGIFSVGSILSFLRAARMRRIAH